jgi:transposase-like protein/Zn ribbon nucleic-acid-binding protein
MTEDEHDALWRNFPKTAIEFEKKFATEEDCRAYWIEARWGGKPACARCASTRVWTTRAGTTFECAECGHQTSLTSGTLLEKTHKPLKMWFRAVFEISSRKNGISAKELQRIMGFGSYNTAWTWLHKLRAALVRPDREKLGQHVEIDEAFVGSKGAGKSLVLVATETDGRVRMAQAVNNDAETLKRFADAQIEPEASVTTDGHAGYNDKSLGDRPHDAVVQTKAERAEGDALQHSHWAISLLKRWLFGTHGSAVSTKYLQAYLDEYVFRYNRRRTKGVGRIAARTIAQLVSHAPLTMRQIVNETAPFRMFPDKPPELSAQG